MAEDSSPLKIGEAPPAFKEFAEKHNALVQLLMTVVGKKGVKVTVSATKIIIEGGEGAYGTIDVVGSDGTLNAVPKSSTWVAPGVTSFPTHLQVGASTAARAVINDNEAAVTNAGGTIYAALNFDRILLHGANDLAIVETDLTQDMGIKTIDVCDSGTPAQMLVIGSDPF